MYDPVGDNLHIQEAPLSTVPSGGGILYMPVPLDAVRGGQQSHRGVSAGP